jgi:hypothetical protein
LPRVAKAQLNFYFLRFEDQIFGFFHCCPVNQKVYPLRGNVNSVCIDLQYFIPACGRQAPRGKFSVELVPMKVGKIQYCSKTKPQTPFTS